MDHISKTGGSFVASKNQFRGPDGFGRDSYIYNNNGGFCPQKAPCKIEEIGKCPAAKSYQLLTGENHVMWQSALIHSN
jgi:hypothetical protein